MDVVREDMQTVGMTEVESEDREMEDDNSLCWLIDRLYLVKLKVEGDILNTENESKNVWSISIHI